jgi:tetratricopeptide (TPR) repeat protein
MGGLLLGLQLPGEARAAELEPRAPETPRDFYNNGTRKFKEGKLRDAESMLQAAVAANDEKVQPPALYNLGHVRFKQGLEALKDSMSGGAAKSRGDAASDLASQAIQAADEALRREEVAAITRAYLQGRGARKELKAAMEAVRKALEAHGAVLSRWQRASGDFKSAHEIQPSFADAKANAEVVDRQIAALVDQREMMMMAMQCMGGKRQELKDRMQQLKKRMPDGQKMEDEGEDDEEDDDQKPPKEPSRGQQEKESKEGKEMAMTWEEAMRLLESLKLDANRKLPMGDQETAKPKDRRGKDW